MLAHAEAGRERLSLDRGWLFHLGDVALPSVGTSEGTDHYTKSGLAAGAAAKKFDDSAWRKLDLPHDWAVEGPFDPKENVAQGFHPRGIGWYRRSLTLAEGDRGRHIELIFDAISTRATVWVNGVVVNHNWSGYNEVHIDITPFVTYGDDKPNTIAVQVDANAVDGWWYEGAGIYRHTWLVKTDATRVIQDGLHATPRQIKGDSWQIPAEVTLANDGRSASHVELDVAVTAPDGKEVARRSTSADVPVFGQVTAQLPLEIRRPALWSLEKTNLYHVTATVHRAGKVIDQVALDTGFRSIRFDANHGFFLNGQHIKLQGVCIHDDHAGVGVAIPDAIWAFRLRRLKELGANAIRFSHNAVAAEVLDMADRMGFLILDENRHFNPSPDYMAQLQWLVRRDRHHPSIILWSIFNEEPLQGSEVGYEMARRMVGAVKALDDTRPTTAAMNNGHMAQLGAADAVDVVGTNYSVPVYDKYHAAHPDRPMTSTEDTSAFMTRGEVKTSKERRVVGSYDDDAAPWGKTHRDGWHEIAQRQFMAGGFIWTGFDYRGEPTPYYEWPSVSSYFGIMDMNGFAKAAYYIHQAQWIKDRPIVHIEPHWNWAGKEGQPIRVMVMANMERVKLVLNGRDIGEQQVDHDRMNSFEVKYEPGTLVAVGYQGGKEVARTSVETTGPAVSLDLVPDRAALAGDGRDAMPITVRALDADGRPVPDASPLVGFEVSGAGKALGHGNGDPLSHEDEQGKTRTLFNGLAQLIVQSKWDSSGVIEVRATSSDLKPAVFKIPVNPNK